MRKSKSHTSIYQSRRHLVFTIFLAAIPFLFLLLISRSLDVTGGALLGDISISFFRIFTAYIIAATLAWGAAVLFYKGRRATIALPVFDVLQSFPTFAAMPLAIIYLGVTSTTVIFFLVITIVWPIFFSIVNSLKLIRRDWEEAVEIAGLRGFAYIKKFLIPASMSGVITGSIIGLGEGWEALVATEIIIGIQHGLGSFFQANAQNVTATGLGIFGLLLFVFVLNNILWSPLLAISHRKMEE